jgi:hypothetical protein
MARKVKSESLAQLIIRVGFINVRRAVRYGARYSKLSSDAGHLLTLAEYQEASGMSTAQAYRERHAWRMCFGDDELLEVVASEAFAKRGWSEEERQAAILRFLDDGGG